MAESQYKFLNDRPVKEDAIGHYKIIADQLLKTIHCNLDKPFVIGLFGSWGTGKSSIIEMLEDRCEQEGNGKTKVVVIDAWRKEKNFSKSQTIMRFGMKLQRKLQKIGVHGSQPKKRRQSTKNTGFFFYCWLLEQ
jgi:pantothenate kinase-related protein Tda10